MHENQELAVDTGIDVALEYVAMTNLEQYSFGSDEEFRDALATRFLAAGSFVKAFEVYTNMHWEDEWIPGRADPYRVGPIVGMVAYLRSRIWEGKRYPEIPHLEQLKNHLRAGLQQCWHDTLLWVEISHQLHIGKTHGKLPEDSILKNIPKPNSDVINPKYL